MGAIITSTFQASTELFNLIPYMLRKYDWLSNFIDDFKNNL
jgi:hypothetical protein